MLNLKFKYYTDSNLHYLIHFRSTGTFLCVWTMNKVCFFHLLLNQSFVSVYYLDGRLRYFFVLMAHRHFSPHETKVIIIFFSSSWILFFLVYLQLGILIKVRGCYSVDFKLSLLLDFYGKYFTRRTKFHKNISKWSLIIL